MPRMRTIDQQTGTPNASQGDEATYAQRCEQRYEYRRPQVRAFRPQIKAMFTALYQLSEGGDVEQTRFMDHRSFQRFLNHTRLTETAAGIAVWELFCAAPQPLVGIEPSKVGVEIANEKQERILKHLLTHGGPGGGSGPALPPDFNDA